MNPHAPTLSIKLNMNPKYEKNVVYLKCVGVLAEMRIIDDVYGDTLLVPYIPDPDDAMNQAAAVMHRVGCAMPDIDPTEKSRFLAYAKEFIKVKFTPVEQNGVKSFREWIETQKSYSGARKEQFTKLREEMEVLTDKTAENKSFIKWEMYAKPKMPRGINSYDDTSKVLLGPLIQAIDKATFSTKYFVKGSDPRDWPAKLLELFGDNPVQETDFSSFEAHHRDMYSEIVVFWIDHMTSKCGIATQERDLIVKMVQGINKMKFSKLTAEIHQRLMSGALWTSSANGVLNLLILSYLSADSLRPDLTPEQLVANIDSLFTGLVEGDDGICLDRNVKQQKVKKLGLELKFKTSESFADASFCGIVCDPMELKNISDPIKFLRNFFVLPPELAHMKPARRLAMLRAKALSYKYMLNDCPIIGPLCQWVCDNTRDLEAKCAGRELGKFKDELLARAIDGKTWQQNPEITPRMRSIMERKFKISACEQVRIESAFASADGMLIQLNLREYLELNDIDHATSMVTEPEFLCPEKARNFIPKSVAEIFSEGILRAPEGSKPLKATTIAEKRFKNINRNVAFPC